MTQSSIRLPTDGVGKYLATQTATRDSVTVHREENISIDYLRAVELGMVSGASLFRRFGRNETITTSTDPEDIWATGGTRTYPTVAAKVSTVSSDAEDGVAGSGALTLKLTYLDANYAVVEETITTNGVTPVLSASTAIRMIRAQILTAGSTNNTVGTLTFTIGGVTQATIGIGVISGNQTLMSHYTVPAGKTAHLLAYHVGQHGASSNTHIDLRHRPFGGVFNTFETLDLDASGNTAFIKEAVHGLAFTEKSDIKAVVVAVSATVSVSCTYELLLLDN